MTTYERGDIVETSDPFTDEKPSRPFLIVNTDAHPFHGDQYVAVTLTTKSWYDEMVPLHADDSLKAVSPRRVLSFRGASFPPDTTTSSTGSDEVRKGQSTARSSDWSSISLHNPT